VRICTDDMEMQWGSEALCIPGNKGWAWRLQGPFQYFSVIETTEEECRQREPVFNERIKP